MADLLIDEIGEVKHGVHQKSQEIEGEQKHRKILLAMTEVMGEMIAVIFEGIVVLVLGFPTGAGRTDNHGHIFIADGMVGDEGVAIEQFPSLFIDDNDFTPVDQQSIITGTEGQVVEIAIGHPDIVATIPLAHHAARHGLDAFEQLNFLIQGWVGIRQADKQKVEVVRQTEFTGRLLAVEVIG